MNKIRMTRAFSLGFETGGALAGVSTHDIPGIGSLRQIGAERMMIVSFLSFGANLVITWAMAKEGIVIVHAVTLVFQCVLATECLCLVYMCMVWLRDATLGVGNPLE